MSTFQVGKKRKLMDQREETNNVVGEPKFISYLLNPDTVHDTYFITGKKKTKIGGVRKMLAAHSEVLRCELEDSQLAEKGDIYMEDISPEAFKHLLRYVYGYNNIATLHFDDADDLLYTADKYLIQDLKDQLAVRLMDLLDTQNICRLLNNPACHTVLELDAKITKILQYETNAVFNNPQFVNLRVEAFVKIVEQDVLCVPELQIWKAALKWAKKQACSDDGPVLRKYISQLKHIRIHSIKLEDFCTEVVPTHVLSHKEVSEICASYKKNEKPLIEGFSQKTDQRIQLKYETSQIETLQIGILGRTGRRFIHTSSFTIKPTHDISLLPFELEGCITTYPSSTYYPECILEVTHVSNSPNSLLYPNETVRFYEKVTYGQIFKVPLPENYKRLLAKNCYKFTFTFDSSQFLHYRCDRDTYSCTSFTLQSLLKNESYYILPFKSLNYKTHYSK